MKSDLRNCKVGDTIWTIQEGWTKVVVKENDDYPIGTHRNWYCLNGKIEEKDQFPSAFLECPFIEVKEYLVTKKNTTGTEVKKGVVIDDVFYEKSECKVWKEIEKVTLEIPLSELENNPDLKKYLK